MHTAPSPHPVHASPRTSGLAIASLILSIAAWLALPVVGAIAGVVLGHMARSDIRRSRIEGDGLAVAGLVIGYLHLGLCVLAIAFVLLLLAGVLGAGGLF